MSEETVELKNLEGLKTEDVIALSKQYGRNILSNESSSGIQRIVLDIVKEPMFVLLAVACSLYFILGEMSEGILMLVAMILVTAVSLYQEARSSNALKALRQFTEPKVTVIRDYKEILVNTEELVPGDMMLLSEGMNIPADALLIQANDLTVNESIVTGESMPADKHATKENNLLYQGTTINSGKCIAKVTATGNNTILGKLGKTIATYQQQRTLLQLQINQFVRRLALFGLAGFLIIFFVNYLHQHEWATSLLFALTLAMSAVPEEIPVAFSSFMALGAYQMSRLGIISRQPQVVENLGTVKVICLDKTGTITENRMQVKTIYDYRRDTVINVAENKLLKNQPVLFYGMLASEIHPFDAMEQAIWEAYDNCSNGEDHSGFRMIFEYPLQGEPPMMTHVYQHQGMEKMAAAKGAAERIIQVCRLPDNVKKKITLHVGSLASTGYRVLGVASALHSSAGFPPLQDDFNWQFEGLIALYDPPKKNITAVLKQLYEAKIKVKLLTGDYTETAMNIAGQVGILNHLNSLTGEQVMNMTDAELANAVQNTHVFARMFPDAKLKVIEAIKANGDIVAMTGDGVNDGPALKAATIGIAMGKRGTEIARQAADLILTDDNLQGVVTAIQQGRKIFSNLKKAIRYIISIHIPIILVASLPVLFKWTYPNIFTPIHVIFLELIMGPTCSIFFEREPVEENIMLQHPRVSDGGIFTTKELLLSIIQGVIIALGVLGLYYYYMNTGASIEQTRTIVFSTLVISNIFLTFTNRSFTKTINYTSRYKNALAPLILVVSATFLTALHTIPSVRNIFQLTPVSAVSLWISFGVALACVGWFEVYKLRFNKSNI